MDVPRIQTVQNYQVDASNQSSENRQNPEQRKKRAKKQATSENDLALDDPQEHSENGFQIYRQLLDTKKLLDLLSKKPKQISDAPKTFQRLIKKLHTHSTKNINHQL